MPVSFEDLVPTAQRSNESALSFEDLVQTKQPAFSGAVLPFSRSQEGETYFDPNAGLLGPVKRFGEAIGDTWRGAPVTEETIDKTIEGGLMATPVGPASRAVSLLPATNASKVLRTPVPTAKDLSQAAKAGYKQARGMGVDFNAESVAAMARRVQSGLIEDSILRTVAPKVFDDLDALANPPAGAVAQLSDLIGVRRSLRDARLDREHPETKEAADRVIAEIDDFISGLDPSVVRSDPAVAAEAGQIYKDANANKAAQKRSERLTGTAKERAEGRAGILPKAENRAAVTNSGANVDNIIRQRVEGLLDDPKLRTGFSDEELAQLEKVAVGTPGRNSLRKWGNRLGGGGGLGQLATLMSGAAAGTGVAAKLAAAGTDPITAALIGVPLSLAPVGAGAAARAGANRLTTNALKAVDEAVRKRSPLYEELLKAPVVEKLVDPTKRAAMVKALLLAAQEAQAAERASHTYGPGGNTL